MQKRKENQKRKNSTASENKNAQALIKSLRNFADQVYGKSEPVVIQGVSFEAKVKGIIVDTLYSHLLKKQAIQIQTSW